MKIQTIFFRSFSRRQSAVFALVLLSGILFFVNTQSVFAFNPCVGGEDCVLGRMLNGENLVSAGFHRWGGTVSDVIGGLVSPLLNLLLSFLAWVANVAITIFVTILDPATFSLIMNNDVIYQVWTWVRDVCNLLFIATLLFSAFATIFQIDKYHYKNLLRQVIIMALLVNFSWPISRFIVDFFNSMMYFFVNNLFHTDASRVASEILNGTEIKGVFLGKDPDPEAKTLLVAVVAMFIFSMTLLVLSILMLVRLVALPIIVMFSPIGFAGSVMPFTASYASKWWDKLFSYASYGPIATFMVLVAVKVLHESQSLHAKFSAAAANMSAASGQPLTSVELLGGMAYFAIPIVLFWVAITTAEKTSSEASGMAVKFGTQFSKWAGKNSPVWAWRGGAWGMRAATTKKDEKGNIVRRKYLQKLGFGESAGMLMRRSHAKADMRYAESKRYKSYQSLLNAMSPEDRLKEFKMATLNPYDAATGYKKFLAAQAAVKAGAHKDADRATLNSLYKTLVENGDADNLKKLKDDRWDAGINIKNTSELKKRLQEKIANGDHKKNASKAMIDKEFIESAVAALGADTAARMFAEMQEPMKEKTEKVIQEQMKSLHASGQANSWAHSGSWRTIGASVSDDAARYFSQVDAAGNLGSTIDRSTFGAQAQTFFTGRKAKQMDDYTENTLRQIAGPGMATQSLLTTLGDASLSASQRREVKAAALATGDPDIVKMMNENPKWKNVA